MCSHVALTRRNGRELADELGADLDPGLELLDRPRDRIGPGDPHFVLRADTGRRRLAQGRLGLENRTKKGLLLNARAETVHRLPAFRDAFVRRRCLIPADAFYEWTGEKGAKIAWRFHRTDGGLLLLAGLYEEEREPETGRTHTSYVILTTQADEVVRPVHDRMPVIVEPSDAETWLRTTEVGFDAKRLLALLHPSAPGVLEGKEAGGGRRGRQRAEEPVPEIPIAKPRRATARAPEPAQPVTLPADVAPEPEAVPAPAKTSAPEAKPVPAAKPVKDRKGQRGEQLKLF